MLSSLKENRMATNQPVDFNIESRILLMRGRRVLIDSDLALLYGVSTKRLNEQVKRNQERFPGEFMFTLDFRENLRWSQNATTSEICSFRPLCPLFSQNTAH